MFPGRRSRLDDEHMTTEPLPTLGCPWPLDPACLEDDWANLDPEVQNRATMLASATLHRLTGYQVGGCPITVRPCKRGCADPAVLPWFAGSGMQPSIIAGGVWVNSCGCSTDCSCSFLCEVDLPEPVGEIYEVNFGGTIFDPSQYRVDGHRLVWTDPTMDCPWPVCQDLAA